MTLYYTLVFVLLMAEMAMFGLLILPLPYSMKRGLFTFISENPVVAKIQYWMKITFVFILILFIDSVNRVYRVQVELALASDGGKNGPAAVMGHERLEVQARKFYSQRNMYLCGFTLFLSLILNRTYVMIIDIMHLEDRVRAAEVTSSTKSKGKGKEGAPASEKDAAEVQRLRAELEAKDRDIETLKKQADGLSREYDALCEKYGETQKVEPKKVK
ncbi:related to yeast endoplasmic reticulum 25 kDa transmembrane protein [Cephalotrichum gorgonifer]|uniref:Endoplasmic reticulum transmembrane protein n=1 Tax=Cephalotrichum gorgonifer TaxID=2041049 RepID=A0AAE8MZZ2_9PEZI|nr:related to yeast endoplasmic reticulum 25 kDa transmembrane protein [Cephalotrichum gorgonifer]